MRDNIKQISKSMQTLTFFYVLKKNTILWNENYGENDMLDV